MSVVTPPIIPAISDAPAPGDADFNTKAYDWMTSQQAATPIIQEVAAATAANAQTAEESAATALALTSYKGAWSSLTGALAKPASVSHNGRFWALASNLADVTTQAPSSSSAYWTEAIFSEATLVAVTTTTQTAVAYGDYVLLNAAATTLTLPASPVQGDKVWITAANGLTTNMLARNGNPIGGTADDVYLDDANRTWCATYINSTYGWRIS